MKIINNYLSKGLSILGYEVRKKSSSVAEDKLYRSLYSEDDLENKMFLNVGAGLFKHKYWTNVDYASEWYANNTIDINLDLMKCGPIPMPSNSQNLIYSSHTIEHLTNDAVQNFFNEAYRILKPDGFFRVSTPNTFFDWLALQNNNRNWFYYIDNYEKNEDERRRVKMNGRPSEYSLKQWFLSHFAAQLSFMYDGPVENKISDEEFDNIFSNNCLNDALNILIKKIDLTFHSQTPGYHINWFTYEKIERMLTTAGFSLVYRSGWGQSLNPVLQNTSIFDITHPKISLYVEAVKKSKVINKE
ncbi:methyltransferase domain-containing protein [Methanospirillum sp.]|uniref:class I SAM-dependent methyltransferase n=1 Tax=Methanospirillum sp. TaxID=45200 RepID=UPI0035A0C925